MFYRKITKKLKEWKNKKNHGALCILGARQIGKTTIVREFAKLNYKYYAEINFVTDELAKSIFDGNLTANNIIMNLTAYLKKPLVPNETLILFDEIQECPNARTAIKFLVEDGRFDYIESGSLLGVRSQDIKSYPVGFEQIENMYPMDFEEFCIALNVQESTIDYLRNCFNNLTPVNYSIHQDMLKLFQSYIVVGGMPKAVDILVNTQNINNVITYQKNILQAYRQDITKYSNNSNKNKIKSIFDSIPSQLTSKNRRFILTSLDKNARLERYSNNFMWLSDAGVALPCYNVTAPLLPLELNKLHSLFKLFACDVGLLCAESMGNVQTFILQGKLDVNLGSILENVIAEQLKANGFELFYYDNKKFGEIDFLIQKEDKVIPIEVKSGKYYTRHATLTKIMNVAEWNIHHGYVLCEGNVEKNNNIIYLPWYMSMFFTKDYNNDLLFNFNNIIENINKSTF